MSESNTKKRSLLILERLYKTTDEDNPISTVELIQYLEGHGYTIDRKTLASDIKLLKDMDYDIVTIKSSTNKYFWGNRNGTFMKENFRKRQNCFQERMRKESKTIGRNRSGRFTNRICVMENMLYIRQIQLMSV